MPPSPHGRGGAVACPESQGLKGGATVLTRFLNSPSTSSDVGGRSPQPMGVIMMFRLPTVTQLILTVSTIGIACFLYTGNSKKNQYQIVSLPSAQFNNIDKTSKPFANDSDDTGSRSIFLLNTTTGETWKLEAFLWGESSTATYQERWARIKHEKISSTND